MEDIKLFAYAARNEIIETIIQLPIMIPDLEFDYSANPNIRQGYYMYKKPINTIVLNMVAIEALKDINDMKTVIVYGIIHETVHMFQIIESRYFTQKEYYTFIEDVADYTTIKIIREKYKLIEKLLNFDINLGFVNGIERQLKYKLVSDMYLSQNAIHVYYSNIICDAICKKINIVKDRLLYLISNTDELTVYFHNKYTEDSVCIKNWSYNRQLLYLINTLVLNDFKVIKFNTDDIECSNIKRKTELILY